MMRKAGLAVLLFTLSSVAALALDFNGKWTEDTKGPNGATQTITFDFHVDGSTLTGTAAFPGQNIPITNGKVDGDNISFDLVMGGGNNGNSRTIIYKGTVEGDGIKFTRQMIQAPVEFVAKRASADAPAAGSAATGPAASGPAMRGQRRQQPAPTILMEPTDWRFEHLPTPPGFAPDLQLSGYEEARFAPGWGDNTAPDYFTYAMVISADGAPVLDGAAIKDILEKYFRGLSVGVGRQKGFTIDPAQINAEVTPVATDKNRWNAKLTFFDSFTDGRKIMLNIEARVVPRPTAKKTDLILLVSPQPKDNAIWQNLHQIDAKIDLGQ